MRKFALPVALFLAVLVSATPAYAADYFVDDTGSVHEADINAIAEMGVTDGCNPPTNDMFCPENQVTRGQMAKLMLRTAGIPLDTSLPDAFPDIADSVFRHEINTLAARGIVLGIGVTNRFYADWPLSRIEMVRWMWRAGWCGTQLAKIEVFSDVTLNDPVLAADVSYVWACNKTGLVLGHEGRMFPDEGVTRAQMASFLVRSVRSR